VARYARSAEIAVRPRPGDSAQREKNGPHGLRQRARGGVLDGGAVAADRRKGVAGEHRWGPGEAPGKKSGDGVHRGGRATVGRRKMAGATVFQRRRGGSGGHRRVWGGPTAPVRKGEDGVCSNLGMTKLGGRSPERAKTAAVLGKI
jgi:hypothetical protein